MQQALRESAGDFWRPIKGSASLPLAVLPEHLCRQCATEFAIGARFCHVCGFDRESAEPGSATANPATLLDLELWRSRLGLGVPSMLCLLLGIVCLAVAALSSYTAQASAVEWPVKTAHIIEWLLGGIAAFVAGVLVKKIER